MEQSTGRKSFKDREEQATGSKGALRRIRHMFADDRHRRQFLFIASLLALVLFSLLASIARLWQVTAFDVWFTQELQEHPRRLVLLTMDFVSSFGYTPWSVISLGAGALLVSLGIGWRDGLYLLVISAIQGLVNLAIKTAIGRPRPLNTVVDVIVPVHGSSFPSGHVMFYTVFFGFLGFLIWSRVPQRAFRWTTLVLLGTLVLLIGPSRILLGAHWFTDVVAAYLLGLIILGFAIEFHTKYFTPHLPPTAPE